MGNWPEGWTRGDDPDRTRVMGPGEARGSRPAPSAYTGGRSPGPSASPPPFRGGEAPAPTRPGQAPPPRPAPVVRRRRRRWLRPRTFVLLLVLLFLATPVLLVLMAYSRIEKVDALSDYDGRPAATPGRDYLIVGSDSREGLDRDQRRRLATGRTEGQRTDTIMLLHVPRSGGPVLVSLPRDSYVEIPGRGSNKLNAAYAFGGPQLLVRTVEQATGIRIDDYVEIGFGGFVSITDAIGGVELCPERAMDDRRAGIDLQAGCQEMDGPTALGYVRARYSDPRGDLGRVERQREFVSAVTKEIASAGTLLNPLTFGRVALAGGDALTVDESTGPIDLGRLALAMRSIGGDDAVRTTVPIEGTGNRDGAGSVVLWDEAGAAQLFELLRRDRPVPQPDSH
jgi:LCP family protein required for cell wall assembly